MKNELKKYYEAIETFDRLAQGNPEMCHRLEKENEEAWFNGNVYKDKCANTIFGYYLKEKQRVNA